ncbi:MAG TPA: GntR family transcriptional regulator [Lachnospiraceae bacterium]|jgi:GntR family transcriptional regulator|nr:GntR family transcriptional regulator [Lachnospiraceae bacterium]
MIRIDYQDKRPIYEQVTEKLQNLIVRGVLEADTKLPSVRSYAIELSINPNTIQRAYAELERTGFIYTVKGRGNYVAEKKIWMGNEQSNAISDLEKAILQAKELGISKEEILTSVENTYKKGREE